LRMQSGGAFGSGSHVWGGNGNTTGPAISGTWRSMTYAYTGRVGNNWMQAAGLFVRIS